MIPPNEITWQMAMVVDQAAREAAAWWGMAGVVMGFMVGLFVVWFFNNEFLWGPSENILDELDKEKIEMNINKFAQKVARLEGGKKEVNIAQIKEILSIIDKLTDGLLYKIIRLLR